MNEKEKIIETFGDIADAIREKGITGTMLPSEMPTKIGQLKNPSGNINITDTSSTNVSDYATAQVVDSNLIASNIKKDVNILGITGTHEGGGITPTGTISITNNGTYDVTNYASANVNVSGGGGETGHTVTVTYYLIGGTNSVTFNYRVFYADGTTLDDSIYTNESSNYVTKSYSNVTYIRTNMSSYYTYVYNYLVSTDNNYTYYKIEHDNTVLNFIYSGSCLLKGTKINLKNNQVKNIEDIDYTDDILVWNFDDCKLDYAKPMWIKKSQINNKYWINKFKSGKIIKTTGTVAGHRFFNLNKNKFLYNTECIGDKIYTLDGEDILIDCELVEKECEFYNVYTYYHMNLFAEGILTGYRYNNLYPIKDMKFIKETRGLRSKNEFNIPDRWFYGMRCYEQTDSVENIRKYVFERESIKK